MTTDEKIFMYKKAFKMLYGVEPNIRRNGAWLRINNSVSSHRASDLPEMACALIAKLEDRKEKDRLRDREKLREIKKTNITGSEWMKYIDSKTIEMFLEKLYHNCGNSSFTMQKWLDDYVSGDANSTIIAEMSEKIKYLERAIKEKNIRIEFKDKSIENFKREINKEVKLHEKSNRINNVRINTLERKLNELRKNSVLFSMDDLKLEDFNKKEQVKRSSKRKHVKRSRREYVWSIDDDDDTPF